MANENLGSTVLHEHRRVVTLRHLLALVNFIAIFASTLVTRYFVMIRGTSDGILLIINLLCGINILQILLCIFDYVSKIFFGKYFPSLVRVSYIVGVIWVGMVVAEFVSGTMTLGDVRIDLAVIAVFQFISAIIAYFIWPHIDYSTIRNMTNKNVRDDASKRSKKATGGAIKYVLICLLMIVVQFGLLFAYQLPPKVYDLFSESRQLQYTLSEDGESYEVSGVYQGTSSYVNIPATYNNKPVTKIKSGAISNESVLEQYKVEKIDFGTLQTDAEGNEVLVCNVHTIEKGAINNDKITALTIPSSVTKIDNGAIVSSSLKKIVYEARAQFSYPYLECSSLTTITFSGMDAGKITSLEGMDPSITLEVPRETYNNYREKNSEYMSSIRPILASDEYVVDFYTGTDYYIPSIFAKAGEVVEVKVSDLNNDKYDDRVAPSVDTAAYLLNSHETGTAGSRANSAFRGWYYDRNLTEECDFSSGTVKFSKDTAIYAKWIDEYTGTMVWGQYTPYRPDGSPEVIYWTAEDLVTLPVINNRDGYSGGIDWYVNGQKVKSTQEIYDVYISSNPQATCDKPITIQGNWNFDTPIADINPSVVQESKFEISTDKNSLTFVYDEIQEGVLDAYMSHGFEGIAFATEWYIEGSDIPLGYNSTLRMKEVDESGVYILRVIATSPYGDQSYTDTKINVTITKKDLNIGDYKLNNKTTEYNSFNQTLNDDKPIDASIGVTFKYYDKDGNYLADDGVRNVGTYKVVVVFEKLDEREQRNYNTKELSATMEITPRKLTFESWSDNTFVYDGTNKSVTLNFEGKFSGDEVNIIYSQKDRSVKDVGTYTAEAIGVDNPNYTIAEMRNTTHVWTITPKEITILRWTLDGAVTNDFSIVYDGNEHYLVAIPEGVFSGDKDSVKFIYDDSANTVAATNANKYTAKIIGINDDNYTLSADSVATQDWEITKKVITVSYDLARTFTYNAKSHKVDASLNGIVSKDLDSFSYEKFGYEGMSSGLSIEGSKQADRYVISFSAKNAASYTAKISGILNSADINLNYVIAENEATLKINPKTVTVDTPYQYAYTGDIQTLSVRIKGIEEADLDGVNYDQFASDVLKSGEKSGEYYLLTMTAKDAKEYAFSIESFSNSNYRFEEVSGVLKIEKKRLDIAWEITDNYTNETTTITEGDSVEYNAVGYTIRAHIAGTVMEEIVNLQFANNVGLNAGDYTTEVTLPGVYENYYFDGETLNWSITPYVVDFEWTFNGAKLPVNDGNVPEFTYNASIVEILPVYTLLGKDKITITYTEGKADTYATNAKTDTYKVAIESIANDNYEIGANSSFEWRINPKTVTVTWTGDKSNKATYNGEYLGPKFTVDGIVENGLYIGVAADEAGFFMPMNSIDAVTEYDFKTTKLIVDAKVTGYNCNVVSIYSFDGGDYAKNDNYVVSGVGVNYVVEKATLTLAGWQYESKGVVSAYGAGVDLIYNASPYTITNKINETLYKREGVTDDVVLAYENNTYTNVSSDVFKTTLALAGAHKDNYVISGETELHWSIHKKEVALQWADEGFVYNGNSHTETATYQKGALSDDDGKVYDGDSLKLTYSGNTMFAAGTYTATVTNIDNNNYILKADSVSHEWTVAQKKLNYSDLVWDQNSFTYNSDVQHPTASYYDSAVKLTVKANSYDMSGDSVNANVGSDKYTISVSGIDNANYVLVGEATEYEYVILPLVVNFTWGFDNSKTDAASYTYDSVERLVSANITNMYTTDVINLTYNVESRKIHDAGTYNFTVLAIDNTNYLLNETSENTSKTIVVSPREITLTWGFNEETNNAASFNYDGVDKHLSAHVSNLAVGDTEPTLVYGVESARDILNVGTYVTTVEPADYGNYVISQQETKSITVSPQEISINWSGKSKHTYDGTSQSLVATLTGSMNGKTVYLVPQYSGDNVFTNVGNYSVSVISYSLDDVAFESGNFKLPSNISSSISISKQTLNINWIGNETVTYDGVSHSLVATIKGTMNGEQVDFTVNYTGENTFTNAGSYEVKIASYSLDMEGFSTDNFTLSGYESRPLTINKQKLNITWDGQESVTYDGVNHSLVASIKGTIAERPVDFTVNYTGDNTFTDAGTYTVTIASYSLDMEGFSTANFDLVGSQSKTLSIGKQKLNIVWSGAESLTYDGMSHSLVASIKGTIDGEQVDFTVNYNGENTYTNAGEYTVEIASYSLDMEGFSTANFDLVGSTLKSLKINQQKLNVTWDGQETVTYDGMSHSLVATIKGTLNGKEVTFKTNYTGDNTYTNVGGYTVAIASYELDEEGFLSSNFVLPTNISKTLTINKQTLTVDWSGAESLTYDGVSHSLVATIKGTIGGRQVTFNTTYTGENTFTNVGSYTVKIASYSIDDPAFLSSNFQLPTNISKTLKIDKQTLKITWSGSTNVTYDGNVHALTATVQGTIAGKTVSATPVYSSGINSGVTAKTYNISVTNITDPEHEGMTLSNFALPTDGSAAKTLTINKQVVNISWTGDTTVVYDGEMHSLVASVTDKNGAPVAFSYSQSNTHTTVGSYKIKLSLADTTNYSLPTSGTEKTLTINKQVVNVSWSGDTTVVYDGEIHGLVASVTDKDGNPVAFNYSQNNKTTAGSYEIKITLVDTTNYGIPESSTARTLVINKQPVSIKWSDIGKFTYRTAGYVPAVTVEGQVTGDPVEYSISCSKNGSTISGTTAKDVGTYTYNIMIKDITNYTVDNVAPLLSATIQIVPQPVDITWTGSESLVYDGSSHKLIPVVEGREDGASVAHSCSTTSYSSVGSYTYTVALNNSNYVIDGDSGITSKTLVITAQPVIITWHGQTGIVYDGASHKLTATVKNAKTGAAVDFSYNTTASYSNVGKYTYSITLSSTNFVVDSGSGDTSKVLEITPQPVDIRWTSASSVVYDGTAHGLSASVTGRNTGTSVEVNYSSTATHTTVGKWTYSITLNNDNYMVDGESGSLTNTLEILPQPVKISWSGNGEYLYTGESHKLTYTVVGMNDGIDITSACYGTGTANSFKNAGTYTYTISGINNKNYTLTGCDGSLTATATILPMDITIEWIGENTVTYDSLEHTLEAVVRDKFGNKINVGYKNGNSITNVGTKTVEISFTELEANYNVVSGTKYQTITVVEPPVVEEPDDEIVEPQEPDTNGGEE